MVGRRAVAVLVAGVLAATAAACGGGPSKEEFAADADEICRQGNAQAKRYNDQLGRLLASKSVDRLYREAGGIIRRSIDATDEYVDRLADLERPAGDDAPLKRWIDDVRRQEHVLRDTADAFDTKDADGVQKLIRQANALEKRNNAFAKRYGMAECAREG